MKHTKEPLICPCCNAHHINDKYNSHYMDKFQRVNLLIEACAGLSNEEVERLPETLISKDKQIEQAEEAYSLTIAEREDISNGASLLLRTVWDTLRYGQLGDAQKENLEGAGKELLSILNRIKKGGK